MQLLGGQSTLVVIGIACQCYRRIAVQLVGNGTDAVAVVVCVGTMTNAALPVTDIQKLLDVLLSRSFFYKIDCI